MRGLEDARGVLTDNQSEFFSLKRLILIDSYRMGSKIEVKLDGHTSFNGINGAGKTSLLRLIPLFYGESPNKLVQGGGVTQSFIQYYLSHSTSFIIFEYSRRGLACMVVLHASKSGENVCYRFIDQPFDIERFMDAEGELLAGSDLNRHITKRGEFCSEQITVLTDYRSIIQNTVRKKDHRLLAGRFAFVGASSRLGHIEKIATGMFSRVTNFRDLQRMIVSCIVDESQSIRLESNKSAMESWVKEYRAYQAVMTHSDRMKSLNESALRYEASSKQLRGVHTEFLLLKRQYEADIEGAKVTMASIEEQMRLLEEETNNTLRGLGQDLGRVEGSVNSIKDQIKGLEARRHDYEEEKIEALAGLVDEIPRLDVRLGEMREREKALLGQSENLATQYARLRNERTERFHVYEREQNALKEPIRNQADADRERLAEESKAEWAALEAEFDQQGKGLEEEKDAINERLGGLRVAANSPQPAPKYVDARDKAQAALNEAKDIHVQALKAYEASEQASNLEVQVFNDIDAKIQTLHGQEKLERARRDHLLSLANATPGTLLHFLREYRPEWTADIARVVPEELLLRDDLVCDRRGAQCPPASPCRRLGAGDGTGVRANPDQAAHDP